MIQRVELIVQRDDEAFNCGSQPDTADSERQSLDHQLRFRQKCIELIGSTKLIEATGTYADRMHEAIYRDPPPFHYDLPVQTRAGWQISNVWEHMEPAKADFVAAARMELYARDVYGE